MEVLVDCVVIKFFFFAKQCYSAIAVHRFGKSGVAFNHYLIKINFKKINSLKKNKSMYRRKKKSWQQDYQVAFGIAPVAMLYFICFFSFFCHKNDWRVIKIIDYKC